MARRRRFRRRRTRTRTVFRRRRGRRRSRGLRKRLTKSKSAFAGVKSAIGALVFFSQLTGKDRLRGDYNNLSMGDKAKTFANNVSGRIVGFTPFGDVNTNYDQTLNLDGAFNKFTALGIAGFIYSKLPIKGLPHKGRVGSISKTVGVSGFLGGLFDAPENDNRNRVQAQRASIVPQRAFSTGRQLTTI